MTTDELKAAWETLNAIEVLARRDADSAKAEYLNSARIDKLAEFEAMGGVIGVTRVRLESFNGNEPDMRRGPYVVVGVANNYSEAIYNVAALKKDGTPGMTNRGVYHGRSRVFIVPEDQPEQAQ